MKKRFLFLCSMLVLVFGGCSLKDSTYRYIGDVKEYRSIFIEPIPVKTFDIPEYGAFGSVVNTVKEKVDIRATIAGELMKYGFLITQDPKDENTLTVVYGETGIFSQSGGGRPEVMIQMLDPKTKKLVFTCNAEGDRMNGIGGAYKDAVVRCLAGLESYYTPMMKK